MPGFFMNTNYRLSDYKLIVFDIDGTLVGSSHELDTFTRNTLLQLHELGIPFTLATGKILPATKEQADELQIRLPLIMANGSVLQKRNGEVLYNISLPVDITRRAIEICEKLNKDLVIYIIDQIYIKSMNDNIHPIYSNVSSGMNEIGEWEKINNRIDQVTKCLVVDIENQQNLIEIGNIFLQEFEGRADIVHTSTKLVEILPLGVTKATAVEKLADDLSISMNQVMAFGDYDNDAPMLSAAGLGIAVENASAA
ncbi:MAG: HAD family hydrolase, partial [Chloroflexi bacterium]|nr:HAD family hydrolase [Chloroflexota bacterium]